MTDSDMTPDPQPVAEAGLPAGGPTRWWRRATSTLAPHRWEISAYALLLVTAATMRLWDLGSRALHHDESLHAYYTWRLAEGMGYEHLPMMHGPFQFEVGSAIFVIFGDTDYTARLLYALAGTALVALPFLLRGRLGRAGALLVATMLAFSPVMLYFSRFARNDILMAVWTLGLVVSMWRYLDEGKNRYLYSAAALLALAFATKETTYIVMLVLASYLVLLVLRDGWLGKAPASREGEPPSPPEAIGRLIAGIWHAMRRGFSLSRASRPAAFLVLLVTLSMPLWSAAVSLFQDTALLRWSGLVLAQPLGSPHIGAPESGGLVVAFLVVTTLLGLSVYWGRRWNWPVWWRCAVIFYVVWVLLYSTFFTNITGIGSGMWQSLGYWIVQQGEARGGQPWYYYFVLTSIYEFLPLFFSVLAAIYYWRRGDEFGRFLVYWSVANFTLYAVASEKMPWLMVNLALPLVVLSGKLLNDLAREIDWRRLVRRGGLLLLPGVPLFIVVAWWLAFYEGQGGADDWLVPVATAGALAGLAAAGVYMARRLGTANLFAFSAFPLAALLMVLTVRAGAIATYQHGANPVEMIVYTQTSPDITRVRDRIERAGDLDTETGAAPISVDPTSGFSWPWAWYLRDYADVSYEKYVDGQGGPPLVVLLHGNERIQLEPILSEAYTEGERIRHRWWFPEDTYRGLTLGKFLRAFGDRDAWRSAMDYFLHRKGVDDRRASEDAYVYYSLDLPE